MQLIYSTVNTLKFVIVTDFRARNKKPKVADVFVKQGPFLKMYTDYIREFEAMCAALEDARKKHPEFDQIIKEFEVSSS